MSSPDLDLSLRHHSCLPPFVRDGPSSSSTASLRESGWGTGRQGLPFPVADTKTRTDGVVCPRVPPLRHSTAVPCTLYRQSGSPSPSGPHSRSTLNDLDPNALCARTRRLCLCRVGQTTRDVLEGLGNNFEDTFQTECRPVGSGGMGNRATSEPGHKRPGWTGPRWASHGTHREV